MLPLLAPLLVLFIRFSHSANYYIGCGSSGDGSIGNPWNTPNDLKSASEQPGDSFLFQRGCVWSDPLYLNGYHGTSGSHITFGAYGSGNAPLFTSYTSLNGLSWQHHSGNIYYATTTADIKQVMVNRASPRVLHVSHYPSTAPYENGFFTMASDVSSGGSISVVESSTYFALPDSYIGPGAQAIFKVRHWSFRAVTVSTLNRGGESFTVSSVDSSDFHAGYGFFLINSVAFMEEDTWAYDDSTNRLYVWLAEGVSPSDASVDVFYPGLTSDNHFQCWNCKYVTIENLHFRFPGGETAIFLGGTSPEDSSYVTIQDNLFEWANQYAIAVHPSSYITVRRNTILHSLAQGIVNWGGAWPDYIEGYGNTITENTITGVGEWGGMTRFMPEFDSTYNSIFQGMTIHGSGHEVSHNVVSEVGRDGIGVSGQGHHIFENYCHHIGSVVCDVGMYYLFGPDHVVERNIGEHCYRNTWHGTPENGLNIPCNGLYTDGNGLECYNVVFRDNVIRDVFMGVHLYVSRDITLENNILYDTWAEAIEVSESWSSPREQGWACCHTMEGNIGVSAGTIPGFDKPVGGFYSWSSSSDNFFTSAQNNVWYGYNTVKFAKSGPGWNTWDSLSAYQGATGWDTGSEWINVIDPATGTNLNRADEDFTLWTNPSTSSIQVSTSGYCDIHTGAALPATSTVAAYAGLLALNCGASGPDCSSENDCSGRGTCTAGSPDYCVCDSGWTGSDCSGMDCPGSPDCNSHGTCTAGSPPYCVCDSGWTGTTCTGMDCPGSPDCNNRGTCTAGSPPYCVCDAGWTGTQCTGMNCPGSPDCSNRGTCTPGSPPYCVCDGGWTGTDCTGMDCPGSPDCNSHGSCTAGTPPYCTCDSGYSDSACTTMNCPGSPDCNDHGTCTAGSPPYCVCDSGWSDSLCTTMDCPGSPDCSGHGTCTAGSPPYCVCDGGWTGFDCSGSGVCPGTPECSNHGTCNLGSCSCDSGWTLADCSLMDCPGSPDCNDHGTCTSGSPPYCVCDSGYSDSACTTLNCPGSPDCLNHGICLAGAPGSPPYCGCDGSWTGTSCENPVCPGSPDCSGHGTCQAPSVCTCTSGWEGSNAYTCDQPICPGDPDCNGHGICTTPGVCICDGDWSGSETWECDVPFCAGSPPCSGNGVCLSPYNCDCQSGYSGATCDVVDNCSPSCSSHGTCLMPGENRCDCDSGWSGTRCANPICDTVTCVNGVCGPLPNQCDCDAGFVGLLCDQPDCSSLFDCSAHGVCTSPSVCTCDDGYGGDDCSSLLCGGILAGEAGVCSDNGDCLGPNDCNCDSGWHGEICNHEVIDGAICDGYPSSDEQTCSGHGTCRNLEICECDFGYTGQFCEIEVSCYGISSFDESVCSGHGTCSNTNICHPCDVGYNGDQCETSLEAGGLSPTQTAMMVGGIVAAVVAVLVVVVIVVVIGCVCAKRKKAPAFAAKIKETPDFDDLKGKTGRNRKRHENRARKNDSHFLESRELEDQPASRDAFASPYKPRPDSPSRVMGASRPNFSPSPPKPKSRPAPARQYPAPAPSLPSRFNRAPPVPVRRFNAPSPPQRRPLKPARSFVAPPPRVPQRVRQPVRSFVEPPREPLPKPSASFASPGRGSSFRKPSPPPRTRGRGRGRSPGRGAAPAVPRGRGHPRGRGRAPPVPRGRGRGRARARGPTGGGRARGMRRGRGGPMRTRGRGSSPAPNRKAWDSAPKRWD